jgi:hypothetical protein
MAFGDLLDEALGKAHPDFLEDIKRDEPMAMYSFCRLSAQNYNLAIATMRKYIGVLVNPTDWQKKGSSVWQEMAEPFIRKDDRYDFAFHQESPPTE